MSQDYADLAKRLEAVSAYDDKRAAALRREASAAISALTQKLEEAREALTGLLTVEPQDRGHIHTVNHTAAARQVLGVPENMPMGAWIAQQRRLSSVIREQDNGRG